MQPCVLITDGQPCWRQCRNFSISLAMVDCGTCGHPREGHGLASEPTAVFHDKQVIAPAEAPATVHSTKSEATELAAQMAAPSTSIKHVFAAFMDDAKAKKKQEALDAQKITTKASTTTKKTTVTESSAKKGILDDKKRKAMSEAIPVAKKAKASK